MSLILWEACRRISWHCRHRTFIRGCACIGRAALVVLLFAHPTNSEDENRSIEVDGLERVYTLMLPDDLGGEKRRPLIFILHGGGGNVERMMAGYGRRLVELAHADGAIAVIPEAPARHWNDGRVFKQAYHQGKLKDDIEFFRKLLKKLKSKYPVDPDRIYFTGVSNGGMMSYRVALEMESEVAAVASLIANLPDPIHNTHQDDEPSAQCPSILIMNGTEDPLMPWKGGAVRAGGKATYGTVVSAAKTHDFWKRRAGCPPASTHSAIPDRAEDDGVTAEKRISRSADSHKEVILITLKGGGHTAPAVEDEAGIVRRRLSERLFGRKCRDFNAADAVWTFLRSHSREAKFGPKHNPESAGVITK